MYHPTNHATHPLASWMLSNGRWGYSGRYFTVRNSASEYGLSSLTRGRLKEGTTPSHCKVASIVAPFIGPPLSEKCRRKTKAEFPELLLEVHGDDYENFGLIFSYCQ